MSDMNSNETDSVSALKRASEMLRKAFKAIVFAYKKVRAWRDGFEGLNGNYRHGLYKLERKQRRLKSQLTDGYGLTPCSEIVENNTPVKSDESHDSEEGPRPTNE